MSFLGDIPATTREAIIPRKRMIAQVFLAANSMGVPPVGGVVALEAIIRELFLATLQ